MDFQFKTPPRSPSAQGPCPHCHGTGWLCSDLAVETDRRCICEIARLKREYLGDEIFGAQKLKESGLVARVSEPLWINGAEWAKLLPHLRLALGTQWNREMTHGGLCTYRFRIVRDHDILQANIGTDAERQDSLMGGGIDLVILRLGFVAWKNVAAPAYLLGAIRQRIEILRLPLWIVSTPEWKKGNDYSHSEECEDYLRSWEVSPK